jgi:hypothetical protein
MVKSKAALSKPKKCAKGLSKKVTVEQATCRSHSR